VSIFHLHLVLSHIPAVGAVFALGLLAYATLRNDGKLARAALSMFVVVAAVSVAVYFTGQAAEEAVERIPGVSEAAIERHEEVATLTTIVLVALGVYALGILAFLRRRDIPRVVNMIGLALALIASGAVVWTAGLGGQIRHTEIAGAAPSGESEGSERD
jgi:uncharacterized membrane protein